MSTPNPANLAVTVGGSFLMVNLDVVESAVTKTVLEITYKNGTVRPYPCTPDEGLEATAKIAMAVAALLPSTTAMKRKSPAPAGTGPKRVHRRTTPVVVEEKPAVAATTTTAAAIEEETNGNGKHATTTSTSSLLTSSSTKKKEKKEKKDTVAAMEPAPAAIRTSVHSDDEDDDGATTSDDVDALVAA